MNHWNLLYQKVSLADCQTKLEYLANQITLFTPNELEEIFKKMRDHIQDIDIELNSYLFLFNTTFEQYRGLYIALLHYVQNEEAINIRNLNFLVFTDWDYFGLRGPYRIYKFNDGCVLPLEIEKRLVEIYTKLVTYNYFDIHTLPLKSYIQKTVIENATGRYTKSAKRIQ